MQLHVVGRIRGQPSGDWRYLNSRIDYILDVTHKGKSIKVTVREAGKREIVDGECEIYDALQGILLCAADPKAFSHTIVMEKWVYEVISIDNWNIGHMA